MKTALLISLELFVSGEENSENRLSASKVTSEANTPPFRSLAIDDEPFFQLS